MMDELQDVKRFVNFLFGTKSEDEHVLIWQTAKPNPGLPISPDKFFARQLPKNKACFFGTMTAEMGEDDNGKPRLFNRQGLFSALWLIVLDDIGSGPGSKCSLDDLPEQLRERPTYIIETSPDNYQYGYVFDEPMDDLLVAKDYVKVIYGAGAWDSGGATVNKLVKLPCGVNIKEKYAVNGELFKTRLVMLNEDALWTPEALLDACACGVSMDDIKAGTAGRVDPRRRRGTSAYRRGAYYENLDGVVDDVLEWLNSQEMIVSEGNEWIDIVCPWHDGHTEGGGNTAGYKPLGRGDTLEKRGFHCFHDHCSGRHTGEFLAWVAQEGGPQVGVYDPVPGLVAKWAFDMAANEFVNMQTRVPYRVKNAGFKTAHQSDVWWYDDQGKAKRATQYGLITKAPGLMKLAGSCYEPGAEAVIEKEEGFTLNNWAVPRWDLETVRDYDDHVAKFVDFLAYLMPNDYEWFLDHLAAKCQNAAYRGPAVVLTTPAQGTGRGTLQDIIERLWGEHNLSAVGLKTLILGMVGEETYNDWLEKMFVFVPEAKEADINRRVEARAYENLKVGVDPAPTSHIIKHKYGAQYTAKVYASYIICSNHDDVLNIPLTDRRFRFIQCTVRPRDFDYFENLLQWREENDTYVALWEFLSTRDISQHKGAQAVNSNYDAAMTRLSNLRAIAGQSPIDALVSATKIWADEKREGFVVAKWLVDELKRNEARFYVGQINGWERIFTRDLHKISAQLHDKKGEVLFKRDGQVLRGKHTLSRIGYDLADKCSAVRWDEAVPMSKKDDYIKDFIINVLEILDEADFM